uniref:Uncharacterized protein n=1 Tax=Anguilla anguilla TaxID=7936 RepID=A0A0E9R5Q2_ANGAN
MLILMWEELVLFSKVGYLKVNDVELMLR